MACSHSSICGAYVLLACTGPWMLKQSQTDWKSQLQCLGYLRTALQSLKCTACAGHVMLNRMDRRSQLQCLGDCRALLQQGASVLFFPEGTRSKDGRMADFKKVRQASPAM